MGLGAAGALSAAAVAGLALTQSDPATPETKASLANAAAQVACVKSNVRLVEGMNAGCYAREQYKAMRDRAVIAADGSAVRVVLAHPSDDTAQDETAATCAEYDALAAAGYSALSGAAMRREEYFRRACGALALLSTAAPARRSNFADGKAALEDVRSMARAEALGFSDVAPSTPVEVSEVSAGVWKILIGQGETLVYEIAHADFNGDGAGEILAYLTVGAAGGTARSGTIGLMEKASEAGPCGFSPR